MKRKRKIIFIVLIFAFNFIFFSFPIETKRDERHELQSTKDVHIYLMDDDNDEEDKEHDEEERERSESDSNEEPLNQIVFVFAIGSVIIGSGYAIYHFLNKRSDKRELELLKREFSNNESITSIFLEDNAIDKLIKLGEINVTALTESFLERVDQFKWEGNDRSEFLSDMLSLTPAERETILDEMYSKTFTILN
ncbi:MAG: hypothetical protein ACTSR8_12555 [Promethearchaeota archaeon]